MKKGKVFGRTQVTVALMVLALGAAIWLNAKYLSSGTKYLGEASYVNNTTDGNVVETSAKAKEKDADYFTATKKEREKIKEEASELIKETLKSKSLSDDDKKSALAKLEEIADRMSAENNIETLLKAKGFKESVAVINDAGISVVVKSDGLTSSQTLQIQDIITGETSIDLSNIKIIPVN